ncbi:hypothetical protein [Oceanobacillus massiliensis]|uniref:hypothetical protein n=1 Tax=Oceanobacillus massiliensis TaxID=1465765 RepID=UPI0002894B8B|nr:hypothetical protein [Oceanobacillus massiliensis]
MKLLLGTVKGKLIAGTAAASLVVGGGFALANTDAGAQLQAWYDAAFGETKTAIVDEVTDYGEGLLPGLYNEYNGMKADAGTAINTTADSEIGDAQTSITNAKDSHLAALEGTKEEILADIQRQFNDEVFLEGYFQIQNLAGQAETYATNELTAYTDAKGNEAVAKVTDDLEQAKSDAVSDLEAAIAAAIGELEAEIDNQEEIVTRNLKNQVDWAIDYVRATLEELLDELVEEQQVIIADAAAELEGDAIDALDDVVAGMGE